MAPEAAQIAILLHQWNAEHGSKIPSHEANGYAVALMIDFFGTDTLNDLTPQRQAAFVAAMRADEYADSTINRHLNVLRAAVNRPWKTGQRGVVPFIAGIQENEPKPKHIFSPDGFAEFLDRAYAIEHLFRFTMISANTLSRPCAVFDLTPFQIFAQHGYIALNPAGRQQTKKYRPNVPITRTLHPWLPIWMDDSPIVNWGGEKIADIGKTVGKIGRDMGIEDLTPYSIRHTMATELAKARVPKEDRDRFMGHKAADGSRTGERYVHFDPTWLEQARNAIDAYFDALPIRFHRVPPARHLKVVSG